MLHNVEFKKQDINWLCNEKHTYRNMTTHLFPSSQRVKTYSEQFCALKVQFISLSKSFVQSRVEPVSFEVDIKSYTFHNNTYFKAVPKITVLYLRKQLQLFLKEKAGWRTSWNQTGLLFSPNEFCTQTVSTSQNISVSTLQPGRW